MSVLVDSYRGNLIPIEQIGHPKEKVYMDLVEDTQRLEAELLESLTEKQSQLLETIKESMAAMNAMEQEETFAGGFKLGIQFGAEIFKSEDKDC